MSEKGGVRRMSTRNSNSNRSIEHSNKWKKSQDHFECFTNLIAIELEDELNQVQTRWKEWSKKKMVTAGLALFDLTGKTQGRFFGDPILIFERRGGDSLPYHRFGHGDMVIISRARPWGEKVIEGVVLDRNSKRIRVIVKEKPNDIRKGSWRLDRGANRVAHDRMHEALISFHSTEGDGGTVLRDLLLCQPHDMEVSSQRPPEIRGQKMRPVNLDSMLLDSSQKEAINTAIGQRLTIIQGPPGTGKTHTAVHLLKTLVESGRGPILACAESNVAVDNLLEGLLELGVNAVRFGRPIKVRESLRDATMDAIVSSHSKQDEISFIREETEAIRSKINDLKGKEKGLAHRDINRNYREIRDLEQRIINDVLENAQVLCSTNIGAGHFTLSNKKFSIVLIDEATQATEPSSLVPIVKGAKQLILVGDHKQLPPTVISKNAEEGGLNIPLFERLLHSGVPTHMLTTQYRMHPTIREFPSARFYENKLEDGCNASERPAVAGFLWPDWDKPVAFIPVHGAEIAEEAGSSKYNLDEVSMVIKVVTDLLLTNDISLDDIGVVTPYSGQVRAIRDMLEGEMNSLEVKSVDGYQGREKEVIILSTVRSNDEGNIGFLSDSRRLNVAMTRAKRGLIVIGDDRTLRNNSVWASWLDWINESNLMAWHLVHN
ncbi:MAG: AAA domain-containing protein [Candidatus Poseidoniaceae archaeon]|nr:AAA domain-containing protein [Candidatus Poseidoniaceae archaeon]